MKNSVIYGNNQAVLTGKAVTGLIFSHKAYGEEFYTMNVSVNRLSGYADCIPVTVSGRTAGAADGLLGKRVSISGHLRSCNRYEENRSRLKLSVYVKKLEILEAEEDIWENRIFLDGHICRRPVFRKTPSGREIADLMIAAERPCGASDYIPCICWGLNARLASGFSVGSRLQSMGRIQSRIYMKKLGETEQECRTAYEVSINEAEYAGGPYLTPLCFRL